MQQLVATGQSMKLLRNRPAASGQVARFTLGRFRDSAGPGELLLTIQLVRAKKASYRESKLCQRSYMIAGLEKFTISIAEVIGVFVMIFAIAWIVERRHPIERSQSKSEILMDYKLAFANIILATAFGPISSTIIASLITMAGGGLIALRADGWWFPLALVVTVLAVELQGYWFHRLQHSVPLLWSMHSLHHSAEAMTTATGARHFWFERAIMVSFLPNVAMVFKLPPEILWVMPFLYLTEQLVHMNAKIPLGPLIFVFNTPQFHRIHHSLLPQHHDKNFCKNLPILDIIFGTAWIPGKDEYPRTGLVNEKPASLFEGLIWPFRHVPIFRRLVNLAAVSR